MVGEVLRGLEARFPWLARWSGGRLDIELPALTVSLMVHGLLLAGLAFAGYQVHRESQREFRSEVVDNRLASDSTFQDLDQSAERPAEMPAAGSFAPNLAPSITSAPSTAGGVPVSAAPEDATRALAPELARLDVRRATEVVVPTANLLGQTVSIRGNGAETVGGVEGAVDRIATEIIRHLEQGPTLVVWAFDASGSLLAERQRLGKHIETVYAHIKQLDESHLAADSGLLTMVVAFGQDRKAMLPKPTADSVRGPRRHQRGPPGRERRGDHVHHRRRDRQQVGPLQGRPEPPLPHDGHRRDRRGRRRREPARGGHRRPPSAPRCRSTCSARRPSSAASENYVTYVDPKTKQVYYGLPVRQGPESIMLEQIRLPFWYDGAAVRRSSSRASGRTP